MGSKMKQITFFAILLVSLWCAESLVRKEDLYKQSREFERKSYSVKESFTDKEKKLIVDIHNAYRSQVQPTAMKMMELQWDDDIEKFAKKHASQCTGAHSGRKMVKKWGKLTQTWSNIAENLYYSYNRRYSIEEAMYMFWEEGQYYDINTNTCSKKPCGHYRQVVLASSSRVGCAIQYCETFTISNYTTPATFIACNYDGKYLINRRPYKVGKTCSYCNRDKAGYIGQYCRHNLCMGPNLKGKGYDGDASVAFGSLYVKD